MTAAGELTLEQGRCSGARVRAGGDGKAGSGGRLLLTAVWRAARGSVARGGAGLSGELQLP